MVIRVLLAGLLLAAATAGAVVGSASAAAAAASVRGHSSTQPTLKQGATGEDTVEAQCELNLATKASKHTPIGADGSFGPATEARVRVFQQCAGLSVDGGPAPLPVGSSTWLMWQYTDAAIPDGLQAPSTADDFNGTQADLDRLANK